MCPPHASCSIHAPLILHTQIPCSRPACPLPFKDTHLVPVSPPSPEQTLPMQAVHGRPPPTSPALPTQAHTSRTWSLCDLPCLQPEQPLLAPQLQGQGLLDQRRAAQQGGSHTTAGATDPAHAWAGGALTYCGMDHLMCMQSVAETQLTKQDERVRLGPTSTAASRRRTVLHVQERLTGAELKTGVCLLGSVVSLTVMLCRPVLAPLWQQLQRLLCRVLLMGLLQ